MNRTTIIDRIRNVIRSAYDDGEPILLSDLYDNLADVRAGTIRESLRRMTDDGELVKVRSGVFARRNKDDVFKAPVLPLQQTIERKYLKNRDGNVIGYQSGLAFANELGLTSQTASVMTIISNTVADRRRQVRLANNRIVVNAPRTAVTDDNVRLLQVMDLFVEFDRLSELDLNTAAPKILSYLKTVDLNPDDVERIVDQYPLAAQVRFYKIGGQHAIAS